MRAPALCLALVVSSILGVAADRRPAAAENCDTENDPPCVVFRHITAGSFNRDAGDLLASVFLSGVYQGSRPVEWVDVRSLQGLVFLGVTQEQLGGEVSFNEIAAALGAPFVCELLLEETGAGRKVTATLLDTRTAIIVRRAERRLDAGDDEALLEAVRSLVAPLVDDLYCTLNGVRQRPAVAVLNVTLSPEEVSPGESVHLNATLTDASDGRVQPGKELRIDQRLGSQSLPTQSHETDFFGVVSIDLDVGSSPGPGTVEVTFAGPRGAITRSNPPTLRYRVRDTAGDLTISSPQAALVVGAAETVTARVSHNGQPVPGTAVGFAATGGATATTPVATTDASGDAVTQIQAPSTNAVVDVTATAPAPPSKRAAAAPGDLTATLTLVVDGMVTLNLNAPDTVEGSTSPVTADLIVGGTALPGTTVTFSLSGDGILSATSAATNDAGRAEVAWLGPDGGGAATITAEAVVDGQTYTGSVTVQAVAANGPMTVVVIKALGGGDSEPSVSGGCEGGVFATDLSFPFAYSGIYCTHEWDMSLKLTSPTTLEFSDDFTEVDGTYAGDQIVFEVTYARAGTAVFDIAPGWAVAAPDKFPGYSFQANLTTIGSPGDQVYNFTHASGESTRSAVISGSSTVRYAMSIYGNNNAGNVGRGKLLTLTFTPAQ